MHGEKKFLCGLCYYRSSVKSRLKTHQIIHHGEKHLKCTACTYQTARKGDIKRHMRKAHDLNFETE